MIMLKFDDLYILKIVIYHTFLILDIFDILNNEIYII